MTEQWIKDAFDEYLNKEKSSKDCLDFVESLKVDGQVDVGLAVYALAFRSGIEAALKHMEAVK